MFPKPAGRHLRVVLFLLLSSGCSWIPAPPDDNTQAVTARQSEPQKRVAPPETASTVPSANAPQVVHDKTSNAAEESGQEAAIAKDCSTSKPGQVIGFDEFYAAKLKEGNAERLYISAAPGAEPGESYGLAGDSVEAIATALDDTCNAWVWVKWPNSNYRGWLPATAVAIDR